MLKLLEVSQEKALKTKKLRDAVTKSFQMEDKEGIVESLMNLNEELETEIEEHKVALRYLMIAH
jgi:hypothetical protein